MFTDIIWRFLMLETFVMGALCCHCPYLHPQRHFCRSKFALMVKIREEVKIPGVKAFRMKIKKVFKGDIRELHLMQNRSVTLLMDPKCHVYSMKTGDKYVIFGKNRDGNLYTTDCFGNMPWEKTTRFHKHALVKTYYKNNCDCYPRTNDTPMQRYCKSNYSFMRKGFKNCKWVKTISFQLCEKALLIDIYGK